MGLLNNLDVSQIDSSVFEGLPRVDEEQEQAPVSTGGSRLADADVSQVDSSLFEGLPRSAAPMLEYAVTRNPDTVADAQKIAKRTGMDADFVEQNYDQLSAQDRAERQQRLMETMDAGGTMYFMRDPVNAGMAHDDLENLIRIEQESNPFRALGKTAGRAVPKVFQFYNQSMAYLSGTLDSVEHGIGDALGTGHTGIFKRSEQFHLAQSKYINDEVLNSELLALPEHVTKSLWDNPQLLVNPEYLVTQVGEAASSMLPMVAAYTVSGGSLAVPSVVGGLQEAASLYEDLVRDGVDQADAATAATSFGVVVGLLNKVGLEELTRKIPTKTIMQNLARRGAAGAAEGFTEYLEEPFQAAFSALAKGKDMDGVVSDVIASLKNVDVAVGAIILGSSGGVSKVAERVEDKRQAGLLATQNGVQLSALSDAVAKSKLAERSPEALGEFINSVFPTEASEQFVDAQQFATLFQEGIEEGQDVGTVEEVLSRLEVTPEAFGKALEQGSVMPLSIPKLMQHCTKEERELIIPHMKANPLAMSEAESVQTDWQAEAKSQVQQYEPDMELEAALDTERSRIVQGLVGQGIREDEAETMAAIPHAFAKSYSTYGLDGVDFLRRMHVGEVETAQGNVSTELSQAAMRRSEAVTVQEFLEESRAGERVFYEGKPSPEAVARALELSDLRVNLPYDFVQHVDKKRPNHTDSLVAKVDEVLENATFVGRLEGGKARASRYVAILEEGENATAVVFDLSKKKAMHIARPVTAFANSKEKVRAHFREAIPKEAGSGVHGMNTLTNENISNAEGEVKTKLKQGQRGSLSFLPDNNYLIKLSSSADSSTFVHECAHIFLAELSRMTGQTQVFGDTVFEGDSATIVPERVLQDMEQLRSWFGLAEGEAIEAEHQEQFARGFEAYLREGEAPSPELSHVFHRFRQWLLSIYKSVKSLNVTINDDVRDVFDRMLATDEQVEAARNRASITRESDEMLRQLGATEEDIALRERLDVEAEREAIAFMDRQTLRERQRRRKQAELDAKKLVEDEPVYKAILNLAAGRGLDEDYLLEYHGEVTFAAIRKTHRGIIKKNGQHGDLAAVEFGFDDANQFVDALLAAPRRKARIEEVAAELLEAEDAKANHALAENIASGKAFGDFLELKAKIYSRKLQSQTYSRREHLQKSAKDSLAFTPVGEAMRYDRHQYTVRRQSELREEAERAGNANKAAFHLNKERTAHEFVGEAIRLRDRVRSVQERFKNYAKSNVIENHHRDHLRDVLIRFGFTAGMDSLKPRNPDHMLPLVELIESHGDMMGDIPQFDDWLIRDGTPVHWRDLTVAELQQVENLISFLQHKGKQLYKEKEQAYQNELANTVRKCVAAMEGRSRKVHNKLSLKRKFNDTVDAWTSRLETFFFHMDRADGYTSIGKNGTRGANVGLHDRLVDSQDAETRQLDVAKEKLVSAVSTLYNFRRRLEKKYGTKGFTSVEIDGEAVELSLPHAMQKDGRKWTPDAIIGALLHSGSASNLKRLINGYKYIDGVYQKGAPSIPIAMFQRMVTHEELNAIQTIWDVIESTYERVDKAHYAKNGFHIGKVEAQPFSVTVDGKTKTYRGGYMPAVADRSFPESAGLQRQTEFSELLANPEAVHQNAAPKSSFTKNRTGARYPLKLSLDVAINHIYDAIHYSTHAENIQFVDKVTRDPEWKDAHIDAFGQKAYEAVRGILKNTARPEVRSNDAESNLASKLREHATPYILALNFSVAAKQVFSIFGGIHDMGFVDFTKGLKNVFGSNPRKQMQFIHDVSPYMKSRFTSMEEEFARLGGKIGIEAPLISAFGKDISKQDIANLGFWPIRAMDMATTYVLWTSAYEKAMKKGQSMEEAVRYADDIVRRSQPSSQPIDKIMFQIEGGDFKRLFSMFITFTVRTFGARATHHYRAMREGGMTKAEYAAYVLYDHLLPPIAMHLAFALMWGDAPDPDDDEALAAFMLDMGCGVAGYQLSRFPFLPSVFSNFDAFGSPAAAGPDLIQQLVTDVKNIVTDDKANAHEKLLISMAHAMSYYLKIPVSKAVQRMKKGTEQFLNDEGTVANILIPEPKR